MFDFSMSFSFTKLMGPMTPTYHITICLRFVNFHEKPKGISRENPRFRLALLNSFDFYGYNRQQNQLMGQSGPLTQNKKYETWSCTICTTNNVSGIVLPSKNGLHYIHILHEMLHSWQTSSLSQVSNVRIYGFHIQWEMISEHNKEGNI